MLPLAPASASYPDSPLPLDLALGELKLALQESPYADWLVRVVAWLAQTMP